MMNVEFSELEEATGRGVRGKGHSEENEISR